MKKSILLVISILIMVLFTACSKPYEELVGKVYQKEIKPEGTEKKEDYGIEYTYTYPERYVLYVKYDLGGKDFLLQTFYVSKAIYDSTSIGDEYYYSSDKDKTEEPYISKKEVE